MGVKLEVALGSGLDCPHPDPCPRGLRAVDVETLEGGSWRTRASVRVMNETKATRDTREGRGDA